MLPIIWAYYVFAYGLCTFLAGLTVYFCYRHSRKITQKIINDTDKLIDKSKLEGARYY